MPDWLLMPLQWLVCLTARTLASLFWMLNQVWLLIGAVFYYLRYWMEHNVFNLLLTALFGEGNVAVVWVSGSLGLAVLLVGIFLVLRQLGIHHSPVDLRKAIAWLIFLGYLFTNHAALFDALESFRNGIASAAYQTAGGISQGIMAGGSPSAGNELPNTHTGAITIPALFPATIGPYRGAGEITALDLAAYSLEADEHDIVQPPADHPPLPVRFDRDYFNNGDFFAINADNDARNRAVNKALLGWGLQSINVVPCFVAMVAAGIAFGLSMTAMVLYCSLPLTLPFVFFEATEGIALSIIRSYLMLIFKTWIINMILAIFLGFNAYWAVSGNAGIFVAMSCVTLYFCWQFVHLTKETFYQALNAVTTGIGHAVGVKMIDPVKTTQQIAQRTAQAAISAAAVVATGGAAAPAVAGALLSSMGATSGGSALMYAATRNQKQPGEFARRGLAARNGNAAEVLTPEEQQLATQAAAIQTGQAPGDHAWAATTLTTLGQRAQSRRAGTAALRQSLTQAGVLPPEEQQREAQQQQRDQMQRIEQALGLDLRGANASPAEMEEALTAAAVLEGQIPGDRTQAQSTLNRIGGQARATQRQRQALRATLTQAGVLAADDDPERIHRLQQMLGVHPDVTHLEPDALEAAITIAGQTLHQPTPPPPGDPGDPLYSYGAQAHGQRAHLEAIRERLVEAGILPARQAPHQGGTPGGSGAPRNGGSPRKGGNGAGSGGAMPVSGGSAGNGPAPAPRPAAPVAAGNGAGNGTAPTPSPVAPVAGSAGAGTGHGATASSHNAPTTPYLVPPTGVSDPDFYSAPTEQNLTLPAPPAPTSPPAPAERNMPRRTAPVPVAAPTAPAHLLEEDDPLPPPPPEIAAMGAASHPDNPPPAIQGDGAWDGDAPSDPASAGTAENSAAAGGKKARNAAYWAWRSKQAPGQPINKPRKRKS